MILFPFVQFEYTHSIGPPVGRYTIDPGDRNGSASFSSPGAQRQHDEAALHGSLGTADVLVIQVTGAPPPSPRRLRSGMPTPPSGQSAGEISVTVVTVILATHLFNSAGEAQRFFATLGKSPEDQNTLAGRALGIVRRGVVAYRFAAADPYVPDLSPLDARAVRIGYGEASEVVRGRWTEALGVKPAPTPRVNRTVKLMPVQAMAGILNGVIPELEAEEMVLCAVRDLDHGRFRAAAATLNAAQELLLSELAGETIASRATPLLSKVEERRAVARELSVRAMLDQLSSRDHDLLRELVDEAGALIDTWRYIPLGFG